MQTSSTRAPARRILATDDDEGVRTAIAALLEQEGVAIGGGDSFGGTSARRMAHHLGAVDVRHEPSHHAGLPASV